MMRTTGKMLKSVFSGAFAKGRVTNLITVVMALTLATVTPAVAANGGNFLLGKANVATAVTFLKGTVAGPALKIYNPSTSTGATAAFFQVVAGHPPFKVNSPTKVDNLNADQLDGQDSTALGVTTQTSHQQTGACAGSNINTFVRCAPIVVKVPTGKLYQVTVFSSFSAVSPAGSPTDLIDYCPAYQDNSLSGSQPSCILPGGEYESISLAPIYAESAASSGEIHLLPAGNYIFSTVLRAHMFIPFDNHGVHTTVLVRDARAPGPPIG